MNKHKNYPAIPFSLNDLQRHIRKQFNRALESGEYKLVDVEFCSNCNSSHLETIVEKDRFELPFRADICCDCGLIMSSPRLAEENLPR